MKPKLIEVTDAKLSWSLLFDKSQENLDAAIMLYDKGSYGLAAYHAQQSIETLFKSFAYRTLEKYPEYSDVKLHTHLPVNRVVGLIISFIEKLERTIAEKARSGDKHGQVSRELREIAKRSELMRSKFDKVKSIMSRLDSRDGSELKEEIWRYSLGLPTKGNSINEAISISKTFGAYDFQDSFMEDMLLVAQTVFSEIDAYHRTNADKEYYKEVKPFLANFLLQNGFPPVPLAKLLEGKKLDIPDKAELKEFIAARGGLPALSIFFGDRGVLASVIEIAKRHYPKTYQITAKYFDLQGLSYASSVCSTLILLYPHESFGRYPEVMEGTNTERIYAENATKILEYIEDCKRAREQISALIK